MSKKRRSPGVREKELLHVRDSVFSDLVDEAVERIQKGQIRGDKPIRSQPVSYFTNPYDYFSNAAGRWQERPSSLNFETERVIAKANPVIAAIINTRVNQVATFSAPSRLMELSGNPQLGFKIVHKNSEKKLTSGEKNFIIDLEHSISNCGFTDFKTVYDRDDFDTWLRKITRDSLTYDAATSELVPTFKGGVAEFHAVDASTIRFTRIRQDMDEDDETAFVQVINGRAMVEFTPEEMLYGIRNPITNLNDACYGLSEIEQLLSVVTNIFNAMTHNAQFFKKGAAVKGILNFKIGQNGEAIPDNQFESFRRAFELMTTGSSNAWKTPIVQSPDLQFVNMSSTNREMEFAKYLDFLVKLASAIYQIDSSEIGFYMQAGSGSDGSFFESNQEQKLKASKDKGLRPLLTIISRWINKFIIARVAPEFLFSWDGLELKSEKEIIDIRKAKVESYATLDEIRTEAGLPPKGKDAGGDLILNPQYIQAMNQQNMMNMQKEQLAEQMTGGEDEEESSDQEFNEQSQNQKKEDEEKPSDQGLSKQHRNPKKEKPEESELVEKSFTLPARERKYINIYLEG